MLIRGLLLFSIVVISGCNYFQPATEAQCETLYDHIIALNFSDPNNSQIQNDLLNSLATTGVELIFNLTGQKEKIVRRCTTTLNQLEVTSCIKTKNKEEWQNNCNFKLE